jgi:glycosyltransferase involved in cell wall biosynthesis
MRFSPETKALVVLRNADLGFTNEALKAARKRRIPLVYDTDDLLIALPEDCPVAGEYAAIRPHMIRWIQQADHVTVSTPALAEEMAELNPSVSVLPNALDVELWGISEILPPSDSAVTIGFWGSGTRIPDLRRLTRGLRHLKQRYGSRVRFHFWGSCDPELLSVGDVTVSGHVTSYAEYALASRHCRLDIALAPLVHNRFNRCKSAIKFLEYGIRGACGLYADLDPYQSVVRHGENGLLVGPDPDDWIAAMTRLIDDPAFRHRLACQAQSDVLARHTLAQHAWRWRDTYQSLIQSCRTVEQPGAASRALRAESH